MCVLKAHVGTSVNAGWGILPPMTYADLLRQRLHNQHVAGRPLATPDDVVTFMGAVQAQDLAAASWALGQRVRAATQALIDEAFARAGFLRTHMMRPTWHFVSPADLRWLLKLTAPRVNAVCAHYYRKYELDDRVFAKSTKTLRKALTGGKQLTRRAIQLTFEKARISRPGDDPLRLIFLLLRAELDGLICSGPRDGKQITYALLEERVPPARVLGREDARAELAHRYFTSHGPATLKDFMWWSGLAGADARPALEGIEAQLVREETDGRAYYRSPTMKSARRGSTTAYLLPAYDESLLSYRDSREAFIPYMKQATRDNGQIVVVDGQPIGTWRRRQGKDSVVIEAEPFDSLTRGQRDAIAAAVNRLGGFLNVPAIVEYRR